MIMHLHLQGDWSPTEWLQTLPGDWSITNLKYVCTVLTSNVDKKSIDGEQPISLCNYTDVYYNQQISTSHAFMRATATAEQIKKFTLRKDDVIITKDSETADDIAVPAFVPQDLPGVVCGYHLAILRPHRKTCGSFLRWLFESEFIKANVAIRANGLTRVGLSYDAIGGLAIPHPDFHQQKAIATFLDRETAKIDALVAEQRRLIALLKEKRQAVISHAVTKGLDPTVPMKDSGIESLGDVPEHWEVKRVKHAICSIEQGWSPQCENAPALDDNQWGVLKVGSVNYGKFTPSENKSLPATLTPQPELAIRQGDLLISRANTTELVGSAAVAELDYGNLMLCDKLYRLRMDHSTLLPTFLCHVLNSKASREPIEIGATGASASMKNIAQSVILELWFAAPSIEEQSQVVTAIKERWDKTTALIDEAVHAIALLQERRTALISAAVTGKIDVRKHASQETA